MKRTYTLTIVYNEDKEEIEYISEELEGDAKGILEENGVVDVGEYFDEDDLEIISGSYIIGEA